MFWQEIKKQVKVFDGVIILVLLLLSFLPLALFTLTQGEASMNPEETVAVVSIDGKVVAEFPLNKDTPHQEKTFYPKGKQYNIVEIEGKRARVKEDNSPDQVAVNTGWISKTGQTSICLPHRLILEIKGTPSDLDDDMIISY